MGRGEGRFLQLSWYTLGKIRDDGEVILYRARWKQTKLPSALLLASASPQSKTFTQNEQQGETGMTELKIPLGITEDDVALGSHLVYLWQTDEEFESGVRFLQLGIANKSEYCVLFGQDEPKERVLKVLRKISPGLDLVLEERRLVTLCCDSSASATLANIEAHFGATVATGATAIRFLGTLGMGGKPLLGKDMDEALELERGVTALALRYPCVMVCMYDVTSVSGRLLLAGGFATHPLTVWNDGLKENPYCQSKQQSSPSAGDQRDRRMLC